MKLAKEIRNLLITLLGNQDTVASWGISNILIRKKCVCFDVSGFKYQGPVEISSTCNNCFGVKIGESDFVTVKLEDVISTIDNGIEHTETYCDDIEKWVTK